DQHHRARAARRPRLLGHRRVHPEQPVSATEDTEDTDKILLATKPTKPTKDFLSWKIRFGHGNTRKDTECKTRLSLTFRVVPCVSVANAVFGFIAVPPPS